MTFELDPKNHKRLYSFVQRRIEHDDGHMWWIGPLQNNKPMFTYAGKEYDVAYTYCEVARENEGSFICVNPAHLEEE